MNTTIYLVRHGITDLNKAICYQGIIDMPLNAMGEAQGKHLSQRFKDTPIDIAISSPLVRTKKTMKYILTHHPDVKVIYDDELLEKDGGLTEEQPFLESDAFWPGYVEDFQYAPSKWAHVGGESGEEAYERFQKAINRIARENAGKNIVVASHGFVILTFINYAKGRSKDDMIHESIGNVSVSKFTFDDDFNMHMDYFGDDTHLPAHLHHHHDDPNLFLPKPIIIGDSKNKSCRKGKSLLSKLGFTTIDRDLSARPLRIEELTILMDRYNGEPSAFFNTGSSKYKSLHLKDRAKSMDQSEIIDLLIRDNKLVKRPILMWNGQVALGFDEKIWKAMVLANKQ